MSVLVSGVFFGAPPGDDFATAENMIDADSCLALAELHDTPLSTEIPGRERGSSQAASRVTSAVTHIGETECMQRSFSGSAAPAPEPSTSG